MKEDDHVASYKPIPESDTDFRTSKSSLGKSKEKVSDGAEEKLLSKEDEAKIVRVDMADAKYVVGDHRNGDAKIELDANKRQFSGLTKEELMKYADDPFWVNLRWCMFVLFWTIWLAMLAGAIAIIVRAPKCAPPTPREWFEKYPLVESDGLSYSELKDHLSAMQSSLVQGVFIQPPSTYETADSEVIVAFKNFVEEAKKYGVNVIVDLIPNYVPISHPWFLQSVNRSAQYNDYFIWANGTDFDDKGEPKPPNNWVSVYNTSAWTYNNVRKEFYLHQYKEDQPDLNFNNEKVVLEFKKVLNTWLNAGAQGIRLEKAREMLVNSSLADELPAAARAGDAVHTTYPYWRHRETSDQPALDTLLTKFASVLGSEVKVFTLKESGPRAELFLLERNVTSLRPASAAPLPLRDVTAAALALNKRLDKRWPILQLKGSPEAEQELALFSMLLPATPVLDVRQIQRDENDTALSELAALRSDASIEHGKHAVLAVPAGDSQQPQLLACARWKTGHTGYVAVFNPTGGALRANLTGVPTIPAALTVHEVSSSVKLLTNYTKNFAESAESVLVPSNSTVVLSYVPQAAAES